MVPYFQRVDVPGRLVEHSVTDRQHTDYCNPPVHARRGLMNDGHQGAETSPLHVQIVCCLLYTSDAADE